MRLASVKDYGKQKVNVRKRVSPRINQCAVDKSDLSANPWAQTSVLMTEPA